MSSLPLFYWICVCVLRGLNLGMCAHYTFSISNNDSTRVLEFWTWVQTSCLSFSVYFLRQHEVRAGWSGWSAERAGPPLHKLYLLLQGLSFPPRPLLLQSLCSCTFWAAWYACTEAAFPFRASLSTYLVPVMLSWLSLALLVPPLLHSGLTLCGQVPPKDKSKGIIPTQGLLFPTQFSNVHNESVSMPCIEEILRKPVMVERSPWILSESHKADNCPLPGNPNNCLHIILSFWVTRSAHVTATTGNQGGFLSLGLCRHPKHLDT